MRGCDAVGACTARARSDAPTLSLQEAAVRAAAVRERAPAPGEMLGLSGAEGRRAGGLALLFGAERDGLTNPEAPPPPTARGPALQRQGARGLKRFGRRSTRRTGCSRSPPSGPASPPPRTQGGSRAPLPPRVLLPPRAPAHDCEGARRGWVAGAFRA